LDTHLREVAAPGTEQALEKHTFYTKVGDQNCGVGFYKDGS